jgi:hypothetical protein
MWYLMSVIRGSRSFFLSGRLAIGGVVENGRAFWGMVRRIVEVELVELRVRERNDERRGERRERIGVCVEAMVGGYALISCFEGGEVRLMMNGA